MIKFLSTLLTIPALILLYQLSIAYSSWNINFRIYGALITTTTFALALSGLCFKASSCSVNNKKGSLNLNYYNAAEYFIKSGVLFLISFLTLLYAHTCNNIGNAPTIIVKVGLVLSNIIFLGISLLIYFAILNYINAFMILIKMYWGQTVIKFLLKIKAIRYENNKESNTSK